MKCIAKQEAGQGFGASGEAQTEILLASTTSSAPAGSQMPANAACSSIDLLQSNAILQ
jgi:hypothetical protein